MSFASVKTIAFLGINGIEIDVQVHIGNGLPCFSIVGLPDKSIAEAKERIKAAFNSIGLNLPAKRITVNMSPASIQKEGSHYDLPIAVSLLCAMNIIHVQDIDNWLILGELSLNANIVNINGILIAALYANEKNLNLICPYNNASEAQLICSNIIPFKNLLEIISFLKQKKAVPVNFDEILIENEIYDFDMQDVVGQEIAKQALEIAAVFKFHVLLIGAPGVGKSMLAKRILTILPSLTTKESLEINMIYSLNNHLKELKRKIPFRSPHHTISSTGLIGGGVKAMPGEISLAHNGILFLDELGEFSKCIEGLRECMETGEITISKANKHITYPAKCQIIAAMNPCKCGYANTSKACKNFPICAQQYQNKISGPILDRFDLIVYMDSYKENNFKPINNKIEKSEEIKIRVLKAKEFYNQNFNKPINLLNIEEMLLEENAREQLINYSNVKKINQRTFYKILKIARTIACLEQSLYINLNHLSKAMQFKL